MFAHHLCLHTICLEGWHRVPSVHHSGAGPHKPPAARHHLSLHTSWVCTICLCTISVCTIYVCIICVCIPSLYTIAARLSFTSPLGDYYSSSSVYHSGAGPHKPPAARHHLSLHTSWVCTICLCTISVCTIYVCIICVCIPSLYTIAARLSFTSPLGDYYSSSSVYHSEAGPHKPPAARNRLFLHTICICTVCVCASSVFAASVFAHHLCLHICDCIVCICAPSCAQ